MRHIFHFKNLVKSVDIGEFPPNVFKRILYDLYLIESKRMDNRCKIILLEDDERLYLNCLLIGSQRIGNYKRIYCRYRKHASLIAFQKIKENKYENNKKTT